MGPWNFYKGNKSRMRKHPGFFVCSWCLTQIAVGIAGEGHISRRFRYCYTSHFSAHCYRRRRSISTFACRLTDRIPRGVINRCVYTCGCAGRAGTCVCKAPCQNSFPLYCSITIIICTALISCNGAGCTHTIGDHFYRHITAIVKEHDFAFLLRCIGIHWESAQRQGQHK